MKKKQLVKVIVLIVLVIAIASLWKRFSSELSLQNLQAQRESLIAWKNSNPLRAGLIFGAIYVLTTALSLPGAAILTLAAGGIFGLLWGIVIVSFSSTIGATLAFLASRYLFRESVERRFGDRLKAINANLNKEGNWYLFTLRLIPVFPFFLINLVMGLTAMSIPSFYLQSQIGMLPGTIVYVNAGRELGQLTSLKGIFSPGLILSFVLIAILPYVVKGLLAFFKNRKVYGPYKKPKRFDYNLITLGAGSAGLVTSYIGATIKAKVLLVERHKMGGDCLNTGCVPSKALIRSAKIMAYMRDSKKYGIRSATPEFEFSEVMERVQNVIQKIEPHDSVERYSKIGVECMAGEARIKSPWEVEVNGKTYTTKNIVIATGAEPLVPPIPGLKDVKYYTTDNIWTLREQPRRLLVLGGGPIGCELAQAFSRLGCKVVQVEKAPQLLIREDVDCAKFVAERFKHDGIEVLLNSTAKSFHKEGSRQWVSVETAGGTKEIEFDAALLALGRKARVKGFGVEELGIKLNARGTLDCDEMLRTRFPNILACGDVVGPYQFTHAAAHQAWHTAVNSLVPFANFKVDYRFLPWCTYTDPEIARVGLNEKDAKEQGIAVEVTTFDMAELDRAICEGSDEGIVKVLTKPGNDQILGVTIVGHNAGELMAEFVIAMKHKLGLNKILGTIHSYPTLAEANKYVAGEWKRAHAPKGLLKWVEKMHSWRRGA